MKTVELTVDWILDNFVGQWCGGKVNNERPCVCVYSDIENSFVELAFETMEIDYDYNEYLNEDEKGFWYTYEFDLEDIKEDAPIFYKHFIDWYESSEKLLKKKS